VTAGNLHHLLDLFHLVEVEAQSDYVIPLGQFFFEFAQGGILEDVDSPIVFCDEANTHGRRVCFNPVEATPSSFGRLNVAYEVRGLQLPLGIYKKNTPIARN